MTPGIAAINSPNHVSPIKACVRKLGAQNSDLCCTSHHAPSAIANASGKASSHGAPRLC